ncbi:uncharacterized protein VDAG_02983 [Verticillium dahliae VdLs.17]|uniref:Uncharacterized protein n=1 Tax=Verticillium dahliae (strain VdLs.17 / ATCC MYA-4575 / FGSC 10137) TaxID=498257 RepID=G2WXK4_VERDV|nr:uncharacterized protein VDAG_02983 [Verticillium dahliae VdLs.17]EGY21459.1 hypothetical protein VDAG_02983 [Verticillium dahliae VdLs.17]KAH6707461.1 hypothetical protein EV126DRAFT_439632 [Verticillium dahliae]
MTRKLLQTLCNGDKLHMRQTNDGSIRAGDYFSGGNVGEAPRKTAGELFARLNVSQKWK